MQVKLADLQNTLIRDTVKPVLEGPALLFFQVSDKPKKQIGGRMKTFIVLIGTLASICVQSNAVKREAKSIANKEEYLKGINDLRRDYAKKARIPNMNKLVWDDYLETRTQMGDFSGEMKTMRINRRDEDDAAKRNVKNVTSYYFGDAHRPELIKNYETLHMAGMEDLTPGQQKIGCSSVKTEIDIIDTGEKMSYDTLCFMEPEGTGKSWNVPRGEPGSACNKGFVNDDGLCSPIQKAQPSGSGSSDNSTPITDGASYVQFGTVVLLLVVSMIF
ncbi:hypothetical protein B9Z55_012907 [Caenorhabditis nigoni]|nr:hypothetical protein B9Z55_012907 [Caenorhabditis nigoni]